MSQENTEWTPPDQVGKDFDGDDYNPFVVKILEHTQRIQRHTPDWRIKVILCSGGPGSAWGQPVWRSVTEVADNVEAVDAWKEYLSKKLSRTRLRNLVNKYPQLKKYVPRRRKKDLVKEE